MPDPHRITLDAALVMVQRARNAPVKLVKGWSIAGQSVQEILSQPDAQSLRAYLAATEDGVATLVYVGVDVNGRDMVDGLLAEYVLPCPPFCDQDSPFVRDS